MNVSTMNFVFKLKIVRFIIILPLSVFVGFELARACVQFMPVSVCSSALSLGWLGITWHYGHFCQFLPINWGCNLDSVSCNLISILNIMSNKRSYVI